MQKTIKNIFFILLLINTMQPLWAQAYLVNPSKIALKKKFQNISTNKKKILIFTSKGGYCHTAACDSLIKLLNKEYDISIVNPFEEILDSYDFVKWMSRGSIDGEELYDWLIQKKWFSIVNASCQYIVPSLLSRSKKAKTQLFRDYIAQKNPDLIISVIPWLNLFIGNAAHELDIPLLIITLDTALEVIWSLNLNEMKHNNFKITIGVETETTRPVLKACGIADEDICYTGFPIRESFFEKKHKKVIREKWKIPSNKFTIMIMMGGAGSYSSYKYAQKIASLDLDVHLLVCVGKNTNLIQKISKIRLKNKTSISTIPFTDEICDLMTASDLLITKPGPGSVNEALYSELPMLIDKTDSTIFWERGAINLIQENHFGDVITSLSQIKKLIPRYMDTDYYQSVKQALHNYERKNFSYNIKKIIKKLCPKH